MQAAFLRMDRDAFAHLQYQARDRDHQLYQTPDISLSRHRYGFDRVGLADTNTAIQGQGAGHIYDLKPGRPPLRRYRQNLCLRCYPPKCRSPRFFLYPAWPLHRVFAFSQTVS